MIFCTVCHLINKCYIQCYLTFCLDHVLPLFYLDFWFYRVHVCFHSTLNTKLENSLIYIHITHLIPKNPKKLNKTKLEEINSYLSSIKSDDLNLPQIRNIPSPHYECNYLDEHA